MVCIYYGLLFFKNNNLKYTTIFQRRYFIILIYYYTYFSHRFLCYYFSLNTHVQRNITSMIYIVYLFFFNICYAMYYIVLEICIGGRFLEDYFYGCSRQIISFEAKESLIPYKIQRAPETQNF